LRKIRLRDVTAGQEEEEEEEEEDEEVRAAGAW
jgi:hypothetical protein